MAFDKPIRRIAIVGTGVIGASWAADFLVCSGPGLRWGVMDPSILFHLAGGQGGIQHFMEHLSGPVATWWKDFGGFTEWPVGSKETIAAGVTKAANGRSVDELAQLRDEVLLELRETPSEAGRGVHSSACEVGRTV
jgi:hypothetical protein